MGLLFMNQGLLIPIVFFVLMHSVNRNDQNGESLIYVADRIIHRPELNTIELKEDVRITGPGLLIKSKEIKLYYFKSESNPMDLILDKATMTSVDSLIVNHKSIKIPEAYYWFTLDLRSYQFKFWK